MCVLTTHANIEEESFKSSFNFLFHFCMQNSKQGINQTVRFPGLSLSLSSISNSLLEQSVAVTELLQGVGVASSNYCPTHLQFLQVVDYSTIPLFWISPLHCRLYPKSAKLILANRRLLMRERPKTVHM